LEIKIRVKGFRWENGLEEGGPSLKEFEAIPEAPRTWTERGPADLIEIKYGVIRVCTLWTSYLGHDSLR
jgi:hypothetical protein